jgi:hypothetical protein
MVAKHEIGVKNAVAPVQVILIYLAMVDERAMLVISWTCLIAVFPQILCPYKD